MSEAKNHSIIGVDLGGTNVRAGKVISSKIVDLYSQQISGKKSKQFVINQVIETIEKVYDNSVTGIGIGVPSVVDVEKGIVYDVQNIPSWKKVNLKEILNKKFNVPIYVNNDANCFVVGEKYFGKGKNHSNIVGLIIGTGLGSGIYTNNYLYNGTNCGAGELGMLKYLDDNYETYCSGQLFKKKYNIEGEELLKLSESGDTKALQIYSEFGKHMGNAISALVYLLDPEIIILGGSVSKSFKYFKEAMFKTLEEIAYTNSVKKLKIKVSTLSQSAILGAAALQYELSNNKIV